MSDSGAAEPIKIIVNEDDDSYEKVEIFADGSSRNTGISGGSCQSGSGYKACTDRLVKTSYVLYGAQFRADYELINGGYDHIDKVYNNITTGLASQQSFNLVYSTENASRDAYAQLNYKVDSPVPEYRGLRLTVGNDKAVASYIYL